MTGITFPKKKRQIITQHFIVCVCIRVCVHIVCILRYNITTTLKDTNKKYYITMSVKNYVELEDRIKSLKLLKTNRLAPTVTLNRTNALIIKNDNKCNSAINDISKLFKITESEVQVLITENNQKEYHKLGQKVCSNWAASYKATITTIKQEKEYIHLDSDEDDKLIIASQIMV